MAFTRLLLNNDIEIRKAPIGFSWTMFCFGFFVPLLRRDWWVAFWLFLVTFYFGIGWIISLVLAFFYNDWFAKRLILNGYRVVDFGSLDEETIKNRLGLIKVQ